MITFNYVRSDKGDYAVQVYDDHGYFCILTHDLEYPAGIGWAAEWVIVDPCEIPEDIRRESVRQGPRTHLEANLLGNFA